MGHCVCGEAADRMERRTLLLLLAINGFMFGGECVTGWLACSTGLLADSLDMLADAMVYGIALAAVGGAVAGKTQAARLSGWLQLALGLGVVIEVIRRFFIGSEPMSLLMIVAGGIALVANLMCLKILAKYRHGEAHMRASWIFSANDVLANTGVIISGILVLWLETPVPDLVIGAIIAGMITHSGIRILRDNSMPSSEVNQDLVCNRRL